MKYFSAVLAIGGSLAVAFPNRDAALVTRQDTPYVDYTGGNCGLFSSASGGDTNTNLGNIANTEDCQVGPQQCIHLGCYNTSGVYWCNDSDDSLDEYCALLANYGYAITSSCVGNTAAVSGQAFDARGWNVVIAYADCNDATDTAPSDYTYPGPNGPDTYTCNAAGDACVETPEALG